MMKRISSAGLLCLWFAVVLLCSAVVAAQEFSADFVDTGTNQHERPATKIYMGKDKMRLESSDASERHGGAIIVDFANQKTYILMPEQKMYMESNPQDLGMHRINELLRPVDPNNACPAFEAAETSEHITSCRKIGTDTVNGRTAIKYEGTTKEGGTGYVWIDPKLHFFLKWEGKDGSGELRNIKEGPQSASLFELPAGYQKFDIN